MTIFGGGHLLVGAVPRHGMLGVLVQEGSSQR